MPAGYRLGRYEVLAKLASGGMARVYVANTQGTAGFERLVAIKVLHANLAYEEEFIRMFLDEARLAARIHHPNVVPTLELSDTADTGYFLVMEYVEGDHLGALLSAAHKLGERIPQPVVLRIVIDALSGLAAAHDLRDDDGRPLNLVHRDVSPHNVLVGRDGVARLTDFGVAKAEDRLAHTRDGQVKGKIAYMAPEQASHGCCDARSDLFAMAIILWECATGRRLFRAENSAATLHKLLHEEIAPPSATDPVLAPLDGVLRKALDRDPDGRYQSAEEFIEALERVAPHFGGLASRRTVSRSVEFYAREKLERDRRLVEAALIALRQGDPLGSMPAPAAAEPSSPSRTQSRIRTGGTPAAGTVPRIVSSMRVARRQSDESAPAIVPPAPAPLGGSLDTLEVDFRARPGGARFLLAFALLLAVVAIGAWWWARTPPAPPLVRATPLTAPVVEPPAVAAPAPNLDAVVRVAPDGTDPATASAPAPGSTAGQQPAAPAPAVVRPSGTGGDVEQHASSPHRARATWRRPARDSHDVVRTGSEDAPAVAEDRAASDEPAAATSAPVHERVRARPNKATPDDEDDGLLPNPYRH